jgi:hypothetical protein
MSAATTNPKSPEEIELIQQKQQQQTSNMPQVNPVVQIASENRQSIIQSIQPNQSQIIQPQQIDVQQSSLAGGSMQAPVALIQRPQSQLINRSSQAQLQQLQQQQQQPQLHQQYQSQSQFQPIQQAQQQLQQQQQPPQRVIHARLINDPYSTMNATYKPNLNLTPPIDENEFNIASNNFSNANFNNINNNNTGAVNTMRSGAGGVGGGTNSIASGGGTSMSVSGRMNNLAAGSSPTKSMRASNRREELQMYYQKCLRGINHSINIIKATLMRVVFSLHSLIAIFAVYMIKHDEWYLVNFVGVVFLLIELFITIIQRKGKEPRW